MTLLVVEMVLVAYVWFSFTTSEFMVMTSYPDLVGRVDTSVPYEEQAETEAAVQGGLDFSYVFEGTSQLFFCLFLLVVVFHSLCEVLSICAYICAGMPTEDQVQDYVEGKLVAAWRFLRSNAEFYGERFLRYLVSKVPKLSADEKEMLLRRFLLLKAYCWDSIKQSCASCGRGIARCCRACDCKCCRRNPAADYAVGAVSDGDPGPIGPESPGPAGPPGPHAGPLPSDPPKPRRAASRLVDLLRGGSRVAPRPERPDPSVAATGATAEPG